MNLLRQFNKQQSNANYKYRSHYYSDATECYMIVISNLFPCSLRKEKIYMCVCVCIRIYTHIYMYVCNV